MTRRERRLYWAACLLFAAAAVTFGGGAGGLIVGGWVDTGEVHVTPGAFWASLAALLLAVAGLAVKRAWMHEVYDVPELEPYPADWPTLGGGSRPRRTVPPVRYGGADCGARDGDEPS